MMRVQLNSLEGYRGQLNELSDRVAMGLPDGYVALRHEQLFDSFRSILSLTPEALCTLCEDESRSLEERLAAGNLLALIGDPRINPLAPSMAAIPGGVATLGTAPQDVDDIVERYKDTGIIAEWIRKECPMFEVRLSPYAIGQYPVTNLEYWHFVRDNPSAELPTSWAFGRYPAEKANHPVHTVTEEAAEAYCRWLSDKTGRSFRLPTEFEWEYAASGPQRWEFPWGDTFQEDHANTVETGLLVSTPVGIFPHGRSPFGLFDMAGNVEEYVACDYRPYPNGEDVEDDLVHSLGTYRIARGGSFTRLRDLARCRRRHGRYPRDIYVIGFRLAEDV